MLDLRYLAVALIIGTFMSMTVGHVENYAGSFLTALVFYGIIYSLRRMEAGRFVFATTPQNLTLWAKRPSQEDSRPVIRLSNGGNLAEGVLL